MTDLGPEQVTHFVDGDSGLCAIVALHDTTLGSGQGGTRMLPCETEQEALRNVLRLSRAMTYEAAAAGLDLGGGKPVVVGDSATKTDERIEAGRS